MRSRLVSRRGLCQERVSNQPDFNNVICAHETRNTSLSTTEIRTIYRHTYRGYPIASSISNAITGDSKTVCRPRSDLPLRHAQPPPRGASTRCIPLNTGETRAAFKCFVYIYDAEKDTSFLHSVPLLWWGESRYLRRLARLCLWWVPPYMTIACLEDGHDV